MPPLLLDLRIDNARVHTMDPRRPVASSLGALHGRIVGLDDEIARLPAREAVDAGGHSVLPGFVDAHNHLAWTGQAAVALNLADAAGTGTAATDIDAALGLIGRRARELPAGAWVDVVGYDQRPFGRHLTRHDLDAVSGGRRVQLIHTSGHAQLVNTAALADVDGTALAAGGSNVVRDADGEPTGLFLEEATTLVSALRTPYPMSDLVTAIETAARRCVAEGVTFAAEAGIGGGLVARSPIELLAYQQALDAGRLPLRVQVMVSLDAIGPVAAHPDDGVDAALALGLRTGFGGGRLLLGASKAWLDGGMMARTAALTAPYLDSRPGRPGRPEPASGELSGDLEQIASRAIAAHRAGWQLALHAIGDRAVDAALDIVAAAQATQPRADARHRIEHAGLVRPDQLPRLAAAGVVVATQPTFLHAFGDDYAAIMGPDRAPWLYRGRSYLEAGVTVAGSSDRPVADGSPLRGIQFLTERRTRTGQLVGPDEAMTVEQAVHAYTVGAAYACRVENQVGRLTAGMRADLVVLGADPWAVAPSDLAAIPVLATAVAGRLVHGAWPA